MNWLKKILGLGLQAKTVTNNSASKSKRRPLRPQLGVEVLESRQLMATGITASLIQGTLFVYGSPDDDAIQAKFANYQIQVLDKLNNEAVDIKVT